jgi:hypothetical protein
MKAQQHEDGGEILLGDNTAQWRLRYSRSGLRERERERETERERE